MAKSRGKQDDLSRQRRLNQACCPTHGIPIVQVVPGDLDNGRWKPEHIEAFHNRIITAACPRKDCDFITIVHRGSKLERAIYGDLLDVEEGQKG